MTLVGASEPGMREMRAAEAVVLRAPGRAGNERNHRCSERLTGRCVSIIIPTRNRPDMLVRCLESLLRVAGAETEIIVVDQSDMPMDLPSHVSNRVLRIRSETVGKALALNLGLRACSHDLVAAIDDDVTVDEDWLGKGIDLMRRRPDIDLAFGLVRAAPDQALGTFIPQFLPTKFATVSARIQLRLPLIGMGANMFVRKQALEKLGGWDPSRGPGTSSKSGDDWDLAYRLLRAGGRFCVAPEIGATHWGARSYDDGSVRRLISGNYYGVGYGLTQCAKRGDLLALVFLGCAAGEVGASILWNASRYERPVGVRRLGSIVAGSWGSLTDRGSARFRLPFVQSRSK